VPAARPRRLLVLAASALALVAAFSGAGNAPAAPAPAPSIGALRICSSCDTTGGDLSRYRYVILNSWDAPMLPALKAANPGLKALVYKNLSFTVSYSCSGGVDSAFMTVGVGYCDADNNHPDWFLKDTSGNRISSSGYPDAWLMDVGNPAYQSRWLQNVTADAKGGGWDGVFVDDTDASIAWHLGGRTIASYPSDSAWRAATRSMLANVGPALQSSGLLVVPNLYTPWMSSYDALATWKDWLQFVSGGAQEYYTKWGTTSSGWFAGSDWTFRQSFQAATANAGKIFLGITYAPSSDTRSMEYARANFLLFDGATANSALLFEPSDPEASDPYAASWTTDIGTPTDARYQVGSAWRRDYTGGVVLVNPTTASVTVPLGGTYYDASGAALSSLTLGPTTGAVLRGAPLATSPPSPPPVSPPPSPPPATPPPPPPPPSTSIVLRATLVSGAVKLSWSGLPGSRVDVFRNGRRIATVSNGGAYTDKLGRHASGTFSYRVCTAGTGTCSATVSVTVGTISSAKADFVARAAIQLQRTVTSGLSG
jgi:hypothetical protein